MQVSITGRHVTVTDNIKAHLDEKIERSIGVFPRVESVHVILDVEKHNNVSEIIVQASDHIRITATEKSENLFDAIDRSIEHAERQLRKQRDKVQNHHQ